MVQVSGGALARTSSVAPSIKIKSKFFGEIGSTQFLEQGIAPCSFFIWSRASRPPPVWSGASRPAIFCDDFFLRCLARLSHTPSIAREGHVSRRSDPPQF